MPSDSISPLSTGKGPGIQMETADHLQTQSWGSSADAEAYRQLERQMIEQGRFGDAQQMGIDDVRNLFGDKYDEAIRQMQEYTRQIPPEKLKP